MNLGAYIKFSHISVHCSTNSASILYDASGKQTLYQYIIITFIKDSFQLVHSACYYKSKAKKDNIRGSHNPSDNGTKSKRKC